MEFIRPESDDFKKLEKRTFRLHLISQIFTGLSFGILILMEVVLKKSLVATDFQVTVFIFLTSSAFLFSIYGPEIINRSDNQSATIIAMAVFSRMFLFIIPLSESPDFFIFCIAAVSYTDSLIKPAWNIVFKHNYSDEKRSVYYSYASGVYTVIVLVISIVIGYLLDFNYRLYKILYPLAGVFDILAYIGLAKMISMGRVFSRIHTKTFSWLNFRLFRDIAVLPVRNMLKIFRENRSFLRFETYFFLYGIAFMTASPAVPIFLVDNLKLDYSPISVAKGLVFYSATILFTPVMGRLHGSGNPSRFCGYMFLALIFYPLLLLSIKILGADNHFISPEALLYFTYFYFGVFMCGVTLSWNLSSIYYSPHGEVANYQAVHITLTGVRGIFAPFLGYVILKSVSIEANFIFSSFFFLLAGTLMLREFKKSKSSGFIKSRQYN